MVIMNMVGGGKSGPKVPLNDISTLSATAGNAEATITWTDVGNLTVNGVLLNEWNATKLVRKIGSAPSDSSDGFLVTTSTTQDEYSVNGYPDTGLINGITYYYRVFSVGSNRLESGSNAVSVTPQALPKTFTITFTEVEDPTQFNPVYSDDASGLTPGSTDFDEFFGYSAVRLNALGQETAEITQSQSGGNGKLDITQLGTLTSGDNVMIKFPVRGIKMTKNGSTCTLSITEELNKTGYQYYAFTKGTTVKDCIYLGTYLSYNDNNVLKSWSGVAHTTTLNLGNSRSYSQANGTGYEMMSIFQHMYIKALYMMKYGDPNIYNTIGYGVQDGSKATNGGTNGQINATYGDGMHQLKLFGLEDFHGNGYTWVDGAYCSSGQLRVNITNQNFTNTPSVGTDYINSTSGSGYGNISSIASTNNGMFFPTSFNSNSDFTKYWMCFSIYGTGNIISSCTWNGNGDVRGLWHYSMDVSASNTLSNTVGSRLMYIEPNP